MYIPSDPVIADLFYLNALFFVGHQSPAGTPVTLKLSCKAAIAALPVSMVILGPGHLKSSAKEKYMADDV